MLKEHLQKVISKTIGEKPSGEGLVQYRDTSLNYLIKLYLVLYKNTANLSIEFFNQNEAK